MNIAELKCFIAVAETLHFGKAAQRLNILPASLGRQIKKLEDRFGGALFVRTTRNVALSEIGTAIIEDARALVRQAELIETKARGKRSPATAPLRVGAIDSAAAGLIPQVLQFIHKKLPELEIQIIEQKTIHLLPKLLSGGLDIAFCRPPDFRDPKIQFRTLFFETAVVALPADHPLANKDEIVITDLADAPLIVPDRRSRPHSHDLTIKLFLDAGLSARIAQIAEEKQTIVNLVSVGAGLAIVPRWTSRLAVKGVRFLPLRTKPDATLSKLILAAAWARGTRDPVRDAFMDLLEDHLPDIAATA